MQSKSLDFKTYDAELCVPGTRRLGRRLFFAGHVETSELSELIRDLQKAHVVDREMFEQGSTTGKLKRWIGRVFVAWWIANRALNRQGTFQAHVGRIPFWGCGSVRSQSAAPDLHRSQTRQQHPQHPIHVFLLRLTPLRLIMSDGNAKCHHCNQEHFQIIADNDDEKVTALLLTLPLPNCIA